MTTQTLIYVKEINHQGRFRAELEDGTLLAANSNQPLLDAARALQKRGWPTDAMLVMVHRSTGEQSIRGRLGYLIGLRVREGDRDRPCFSTFTEYPLQPNR